MTLTEFESEGTPRGTEPISLDDLLARGTAIQWDEAVAIVEGMCEAVVAVSGDQAPVPSLTDVLLDADGGVTLSRHGRGEKSPTAAGRVLHALLANAEVPVPLRLFVTQSTAPETYTSLRAFAEGLAYYGRPNRTALIADVYKRAADLPRSSDGRAPVPPPIPREEKKPPKTTPESKRSSRKRALRLAAACMLPAFASSAAWLWWSGGQGGTATGGAGVLSQASAALTDLANGVRERLKPVVSKDAEASAAPEPDTASPPRSKRRAAPGTIVPEVPLASRQLSIAEASAWQPLLEFPTEADLGPIEPIAMPELVAPVEKAVSLDVERVFTKQDADVAPPVMHYPQLTPPLRGSPSRTPAVNRVEVVVASDGTVERVRFVEGPIRMLDVMLVSSVKNWRFAPARKDGEPVRYQTVISWSAVP
jgi:hypothetical protein